MQDERYIEDLFQGPVAVQTVGGHVSPRNQIREGLDRQAVMTELRRYLEADPSALPSFQETNWSQSSLRPIDYWACVYANLSNHEFFMAAHWTHGERDAAIQRMLAEVP